MTVYNLGSINADMFYRVPHLPRPGETLEAIDRWTGLGGKGANQSVAAAKAGSQTIHIGALGEDGAWVIDRLRQYGVDTTHIVTGDLPTAHAIINVDGQGENCIVIYPGANRAQSPERIQAALLDARSGDMLLLQNETSHQIEAARMARDKGMSVVYSAAPFDAEATAAILPHVTHLVVNEVEAEQLLRATGLEIHRLGVENLIVTKGAKGAVWYAGATGETHHVGAFPADPVDTTGAGDCFIGYVAAGLDQGLAPAQAMRLGAAAAALKITRRGTADAIPDRAETDAFLAGIETN